MNSFLDQLNLTPQERRIVVVIAVVVFVILNMLLVWPHFSDLGRVRRQLDDTRHTMQLWKNEILLDVEPTKGYKTTLAKLERQQGGAIMNQQIQLLTSIRTQASKSGVNVNNYLPVTSTHASNAFFEEQSEKITFDSQDAQLVNFLYNMGNDPSMIRVKELALRPADANRYRLIGDAILSANYVKQPTVAVVQMPLPPGVKPPNTTGVPKSLPGPGARSSPSARPFPNQRPPPGSQPPR